MVYRNNLFHGFYYPISTEVEVKISKMWRGVLFKKEKGKYEM